MINTAEEIVKKIKRLQNGDVSRAMKRMGINYSLNYGVSIPQLRQLANDYAYDNELAANLLEIEIRETKIMASMLFNASNISLEQLIQISYKIDNLELVEQYSQNCFAPKSDLFPVLSVLAMGNYWQKLLALYSVSWHAKKSKVIDEQAIRWGIAQIDLLIASDDALIQKALAFLLQSIASLNDEYKNQMLDLADGFLKSENSLVQHLAQDFLWMNMV